MGKSMTDAHIYPLLPNPGVTENGMVYCNEPLIINGQVVGYCEALVKRSGTRFRRPRWHKGRHRISWGQP